MQSFAIIKKITLTLLVVGLIGCSNIEENKVSNLNNKNQNSLEYLNKHSINNFVYSKRPVQFILKEGNVEKMSINLIIDHNTKFEYINSRNKFNETSVLNNSNILNNNYTKKDFIKINLTIKNHWGNEYLVADITRDYTNSKGKSNLHKVSNSYILGKRGELVPQTMNIPSVSID